MTVFEEYYKNKKIERGLSEQYLWHFYNYQNDVMNSAKAKKSRDALDKYDEAKKERIKVGEEICELSYITDYQAKTILPKFMKDRTLENYEFQSLEIDNIRRVFLVKKGASLRENITMDNLLSNENIIFLASTNLKNGFYLYQNIPDMDEIGSELNVNFFNNESGILKNFIDGYICTKAERKYIDLEDYYLLVRDSIEHGYDEELLEYYDLGAAYVEHDREKARRDKRIMTAKRNKNKRAAINRIKAQRELANLPSQYEVTYENEALTFIRELEIELGRRFSSLEKETINTWLIVGFSENIISVAYKNAQARGTYNISSVAEILNGLITQEVMETMVNDYKNKIQRSVDYLAEFGITKDDIVKLSKTLTTNDSTDDNK